MHLIISTSHREVNQDAISGWLFVVDPKKGQILQRTAGIEPPYRQYDINPRGGMRGMRGISIGDGEMAVANYSTIFVFDYQWNLLRTFTHPVVSGIHEILYAKDGLWVTSTANDLLAKYDPLGVLTEFYLVRQQTALIHALRGTTRQILRAQDVRHPPIDFRRRSYFNTDRYDRTHLNSLSMTQDGKLLLSLGLIVGTRYLFLMAIKTLMLKLGIWNPLLNFNRALQRTFKLKKQLHSDLIVAPAKEVSAVVQFDRAQPWKPVLQFQTAQNPSHTIRVLRDGSCVYLDTSTGSLVHFDLSGTVRSKTVIGDKFLRGVLELPDGRLVVGAGNAIQFFDLTSKKVLGSIILSNEPLNTVFDIQILPDEFYLPPEFLESKTGRMHGYQDGHIVWASK